MRKEPPEQLREAPPERRVKPFNPIREIELPESRLQSPAEFHAAQARTLANQGKYRQALICIELSLGEDLCDPFCHYLHAVLLIELQRREEAADSLRHALYLKPDYVLAHYLLGRLMLGEKSPADSRRHLRNAKNILAEMPPDEEIAETGGMTAGSMLAAIRAFPEGEERI